MRSPTFYDKSLHSTPSIPIMMPYLPEPCEALADNLRKYKKSGSGLILDNQSEVTDLMPDQSWVSWDNCYSGGHQSHEESQSDEENYEGLTI